MVAVQYEPKIKQMAILWKELVASFMHEVGWNKGDSFTLHVGFLSDLIKAVANVLSKGRQKSFVIFFEQRRIFLANNQPKQVEMKHFNIRLKQKSYKLTKSVFLR